LDESVASDATFVAIRPPIEWLITPDRICPFVSRIGLLNFPV
jgi:hypothetical protein